MLRFKLLVYTYTFIAHGVLLLRENNLQLITSPLYCFPSLTHQVLLLLKTLFGFSDQTSHLHIKLLNIQYPYCLCKLRL